MNHVALWTTIRSKAYRPINSEGTGILSFFLQALSSWRCVTNKFCLHQLIVSAKNRYFAIDLLYRSPTLAETCLFIKRRGALVTSHIYWDGRNITCYYVYTPFHKWTKWAVFLYQRTSSTKCSPCKTIELIFKQTTPEKIASPYLSSVLQESLGRKNPRGEMKDSRNISPRALALVKAAPSQRIPANML